ncbi:hypothetical protein [Chengkuizengella sediminis]|nr:hypothetical protein [Chengkuizengella sediminis]NDI35656.1 hypothetical protein [Chengkuizengella sediminis]
MIKNDAIEVLFTFILFTSTSVLTQTKLLIGICTIMDAVQFILYLIK